MVLDNTNSACPLGHTDTRFIEEISGDDLIASYLEHLNLFIEAEIPPYTKISFNECKTCSLKFFAPPLAGSENLYRQLAQKPWYYSTDREDFRRAARRIGPK